MRPCACAQCQLTAVGFWSAVAYDRFVNMEASFKINNLLISASDQADLPITAETSNDWARSGETILITRTCDCVCMHGVHLLHIITCSAVLMWLALSILPLLFNASLNSVILYSRMKGALDKESFHRPFSRSHLKSKSMMLGWKKCQTAPWNPQSSCIRIKR